MPLTRSTLERTAATESYALLRSGRRGYQVRGDRGLAPLMRVELDPLYRRARFPGYRVRRRSLASSDLWLVHEEDGPVAVALKESWPLGLRYRVEWTGGELVLLPHRDVRLVVRRVLHHGAVAPRVIVIAADVSADVVERRRLKGVGW